MPQTDSDIEAILALGTGTFALPHGCHASVVTLPPETVLIPQLDKTAKCPFTGLTRWSCQCWHCQGLPKTRHEAS